MLQEPTAVDNPGQSIVPGTTLKVYMKKGPDRRGSTGGAENSLSQIGRSAPVSRTIRHHVLTDAYGRPTTLLCRDTGSLFRLDKGVRA